MKHAIRGYAPAEEIPSFKMDVSLTVAELKPIMGWVEDDDFLYVYKLTGQQVMVIEKVCSLEFPKDLELHLNCYA
ncbi:hypothetical protein PS3A_32470 [Pseudomonas sp. 3A(2025)]